MKRRAPYGWLLVSVLGLAAGCKGAGEVRGPSTRAQGVRLEFSPPAGRWLTERSVVTRTESSASPDEKGSPLVESVESTLRSRFERSPEGWGLRQEVPSITVKRKGEEVRS